MKKRTACSKKPSRSTTRTPQAYLGMAQVETEGFSQGAVEAAQKAAELDPKLYEAHEQLAYLALEDNDEETRRQGSRQGARRFRGEALDAMAIHASIDLLHDKNDTPWIDRILKINPAYGEAYSTAGHFYVINRRYDEGIQVVPQGAGTESAPVGSARAVGRQPDAPGQGRRSPPATRSNATTPNYKSYETVNSLRLLDSYKDFVTFKTPTTILRLHKKEAELLRPYFESEMKRDIAAYSEKYQMKLKGPVQVEVYPDHEDFAVRTMGMPGLGALGVTFNSRDRHGQPVRPPAGKLSLGQHPAARDEPRLRAASHQQPRAALVHRRSGGL